MVLIDHNHNPWVVNAYLPRRPARADGIAEPGAGRVCAWTPPGPVAASDPLKDVARGLAEQTLLDAQSVGAQPSSHSSEDQGSGQVYVAEGSFCDLGSSLTRPQWASRKRPARAARRRRRSRREIGIVRSAGSERMFRRVVI